MVAMVVSRGEKGLFKREGVDIGGRDNSTETVRCKLSVAGIVFDGALPWHRDDVNRRSISNQERPVLHERT